VTAEMLALSVGCGGKAGKTTIDGSVCTGESGALVDPRTCFAVNGPGEPCAVYLRHEPARSWTGKAPLALATFVGRGTAEPGSLCCRCGPSAVAAGAGATLRMYATSAASDTQVVIEPGGHRGGHGRARVRPVASRRAALVEEALDQPTRAEAVLLRPHVTDVL
jgi:hypothetical protein